MSKEILKKIEEAKPIVDTMRGYAYLEYFEGVHRDKLLDIPYKIEMGTASNQYIQGVLEQTRQDLIKEILEKLPEIEERYEGVWHADDIITEVKKLLEEHGKSKNNS